MKLLVRAFNINRIVSFNINRMISQNMKSMVYHQYFSFSKREKDLDAIISSHKSKDGLDAELKKYENNLKIEQVQINIKDIVIPKEHLDIKYSRSSGAGGQHVNKTNTKAEIRFNIDTAHWLSDDVKKKLKAKYPQFLNQENYFILQSQQGREQESNLKDAIDKLRLMVWECSLPEKERLNLIPPETKDLQKKRIDVKRKKSEVKSTRSIR